MEHIEPESSYGKEHGYGGMPEVPPTGGKGIIEKIAVQKMDKTNITEIEEAIANLNDGVVSVPNQTNLRNRITSKLGAKVEKGKKKIKKIMDTWRGKRRLEKNISYQEKNVIEKEIPEIKEALGSGATNTQYVLPREIRETIKTSDRIMESLQLVKPFDSSSKKILPFELISFITKDPKIRVKINKNLYEHLKMHGMRRLGQEYREFPKTIKDGKEEFDQKKWDQLPPDQKEEICRMEAFKLIIRDQIDPLQEESWQDTPQNREISQFLREYLAKNRLGIPHQEKEVSQYDIVYMQRKMKKFLKESIQPLSKKYKKEDLHSLDVVASLIKKNPNDKALKQHFENLLDFISINPQFKVKNETGGVHDIYQVQWSSVNEAKGHLSSKQKIKVLIDTARGLRFLQKCGLLHLDLAARNLVLGIMKDDLHTQMIDFDTLQKNDLPYLLKTGPVVWLAPEVVLRHPSLHPKTDLWSFGIVLRELMQKEGEEGFYQIPDAIKNELEATNQQRRLQNLPDESPDKFYILKSITSGQGVELFQTLSDQGQKKTEEFFTELENETPYLKEIIEPCKKLMQNCFSVDPEERPDIDDLVENLQKFHDLM